MHVSGIVVATTAEHLQEVRLALQALPGVEVHHSDAASGRLVVVLESEGLQAQGDGLRQMQALPHVAYAELVFHHVGDEAA